MHNRGVPPYTFELHVVLKKFKEQPVHMTKRVVDTYATIIVELAYQMCRSYIDAGWRVDTIECRDYHFLSDDTLTWYDEG